MPTARTDRSDLLTGDETDGDLISTPKGLPSNQALLAGLLALEVRALLAARDNSEPPRPEVVLSDLGMTLGQIALIAGRNYESVKSTIRRAKPRT